MNIIRIPTVQYGYMEFPFSGTPEEVITEHNRILQLYNGGFGLEPKEWNKWLDKYLTDKTGDADIYAQMSSQQQNVIQEIKRAIKRLEYKNESN